jgi:transaldolase/glucose-6-phosphate isomerase
MMTPATGPEIVERIWARDASLWTGADEAQWLGWLDEPMRMLERVHELLELAARLEYARVVLLGMGGSSLAPEVVRRTFDVALFDVLDTTHPEAIRRLAAEVDPERTLFVVSSKSGGTLETRSHFDYFWEVTGGNPERFLVITDPGSALESLAQTRSIRVCAGEPTIGGRYSALSPFGIVPAALMGLDLERLLQRAQEMADACRGADGNPGLELGVQLGEGWRAGRDKVAINPDVGGFGLWAEQLIAESTGKEGKGLVPAPGESPEGPDRQAAEVRLPHAYELGQEFYRWEFATAVAGAIMGINPFDQPNVQAVKDRTSAVLDSDRDPELGPEGSVDELLAQARPGEHYVCLQAFVDPARKSELDGLVSRARETGCVVTKGLGPRYLHSTGQLHKGGPNTGLFVQVVDDPGEELPIPGKPFGFGRLIRAQAAGDYESLKERGRSVARVRLEDLER